MNKIHVRSETNESCNQSTKLEKNGNIFKSHVKFICYQTARLLSLPTYYSTHVLQIVTQQGWTLKKVACFISIWLYITLEEKFDISTKKSQQVPPCHCIFNVTQYINKFITNKLHLSLNRELLLRASGIIYSNFQEAPIYTLFKPSRLVSHVCHSYRVRNTEWSFIVHTVWRHTWLTTRLDFNRIHYSRCLDAEIFNNNCVQF
jgi:hypothetical protein